MCHWKKFKNLTWEKASIFTDAVSFDVVGSNRQLWLGCFKHTYCCAESLKSYFLPPSNESLHQNIHMIQITAFQDHIQGSPNSNMCYLVIYSSKLKLSTRIYFSCLQMFVCVLTTSSQKSLVRLYVLLLRLYALLLRLYSIFIFNSM